MANIVLLSCTKSKLDKKSKAKDLYSPSPMFQKTMAYGESLHPDKMYILSAKHHLVNLDTVLEPYNLTLKDMKADDKKAWGEKVISQMKKKGLDLENDTFIFLAGSEYIKPIEEYLTNVEKPLEGKRMGERLKWLNTQIQKIKEALKKLKKIIYESLKK